MKTENLLLKMKDGGITNIYVDSDYHLGCVTCNYGSCYMNEFTIYLTSGRITVECGQMYEYPFQKDDEDEENDNYDYDECGWGNAPWSEGDLMRIILPNNDAIKEMTEEEFVEWFKEELFTHSKGGFLADRKENFKFIKN